MGPAASALRWPSAMLGIMVRVPGPTGYKGVGAIDSRRKRGPYDRSIPEPHRECRRWARSCYKVSALAILWPRARGKVGATGTLTSFPAARRPLQYCGSGAKENTEHSRFGTKENRSKGESKKRGDRRSENPL